MRKNIEELPEAVTFWGNLRVCRLQCNYLSLHDGIDKSESLYFHKNITNQIFREAIKKKKKFPKMSLSLPPFINHSKKYAEKQNKKCAYPWVFTMIDVDGRVFPDYHSWGMLEMGNLLRGNEIFEKIWNSPIYNELRHAANNEKAPKFYSYCAICPSKKGLGSKSLHFGDQMLIESLDVEERDSFRARSGRH